MNGAAIIAFHGSWNRDVVTIPVETTIGMPFGDEAPIAPCLMEGWVSTGERGFLPV
eukprot:CAMPEP_0194384378 /NCGR_PEP_ID=MMETSP0174-20130528/73683_1 /TAXON_ID=216777 /ORGANISM="Proboscia alata, Strain PI-D3" /LENGTH=55 /DNA_ID=CAMNT_0039171527 /DNA_START=1 /DNA_END=168 /DNA_ORIENTATION=-